MARSWVAAWATAPIGGAPVVGQFDRGFTAGQTIRQVVPLAAGGSAVRVRLTNAYGVQPVVLAGVALQDAPVLFERGAGVTVPTGGAAVSDELELAVSPQSDVVIELTLTEGTGHPTRGLSGATSVVVDGRGEIDAGAYAWFVSGIDVLADADSGCV